MSDGGRTVDPRERTVEDAECMRYRVTPEGELDLHVWRSAELASGMPGVARPGMVFFFGGGWKGGQIGQFAPQCRALRERGMVAICAEYRVSERHGTDPFAAVEDAKAALRWVRDHAAALNIDPARLGAGGGSAGGHLAACTAVLQDSDPELAEPTSCRPDLLVLFNPVLDTSEKGYGFDRMRERWRELSPVHHVDVGLPATLVMVGDADTTTPVENSERFKQRMEACGNTCELEIYPDQKHGFFNNGEMYEKTLARMLAFLAERGWVN